MSPARSRKVKNSPLTTYTWTQVPRQLVQDAIAKCRAESPPISLKWKLIQLLREWVYPMPKPNAAGIVELPMAAPKDDCPF